MDPKLVIIVLVFIIIMLIIYYFRIQIDIEKEEQLKKSISQPQFTNIVTENGRMNNIIKPPLQSIESNMDYDPISGRILYANKHFGF